MPMKPVLHCFAYGLDFLRDQVAEIAAPDMVAQPGGIRNHPAWTIGHVAYACQMLGGVVGVAPFLPAHWASRYASGTLPVADLGQYDAKPDLLAALQEAQSRITGAVERLDAAQLDTIFPVESYRPVFPTIRHALTQVLVGHTSYHIGQLSIWRKAMGMAPVARVFE